jgi:hypothetical protein
MFLASFLSSACALYGAAGSTEPRYEDAVSSLLNTYVDEMNGLNSLLKTTDINDSTWQAGASVSVGELLSSSQAIRALNPPQCYADSQQELLLGLDAVDAALNRFLDGVSSRNAAVVSGAVRSLGSSVVLVNAAIDSLTRLTCN